MTARVVAAEPTTVLEDVELERALLAPRWIVIVWNDPINLMTYVTFVFRKLFGYSQAHARELMLKVYSDELLGPVPTFPVRMEQRITRYLDGDAPPLSVNAASMYVQSGTAAVQPIGHDVGEVNQCTYERRPRC